MDTSFADPLFEVFTRKGIVREALGPLPANAIVEYSYRKAYMEAVGKLGAPETDPEWLNTNKKRVRKGPAVALTFGKKKWDKLRNDLSTKVRNSGLRSYIDHIGAPQEDDIRADYRKLEASLVERAEEHCMAFLNDRYGVRGVAMRDSHTNLIIMLATALEQGDKEPLGELMFKVYAAGGWPCGWRGSYPKGAIVVFWPHDTDPEFEQA